nr:MAG TPA: hypothetical protein [Caudoviricetes sp.]DAS84699.1 MAG TPA: hypothetical protein [Caudoviricetes sp.]
MALRLSPIVFITKITKTVHSIFLQYFERS